MENSSLVLTIRLIGLSYACLPKPRCDSSFLSPVRPRPLLDAPATQTNGSSRINVSHPLRSFSVGLRSSAASISPKKEKSSPALFLSHPISHTYPFTLVHWSVNLLSLRLSLPLSAPSRLVSVTPLLLYPSCRKKIKTNEFNSRPLPHIRSVRSFTRPCTLSHSVSVI